MKKYTAYKELSPGLVMLVLYALSSLAIITFGNRGLLALLIVLTTQDHDYEGK